MTNRAARRANLNRRPKAMRRIEAQVNRHTADELHALLVAQGVARIAPQDPLDLYFVQCAYVRIAALRRQNPDTALAAVEAEVRQKRGGLGMPL